MDMDFEIEELAYRAGGKSESETEEALNEGDIDDFLLEKYEVTFEQYCKIVRDLIPFTNAWQSPLTKELYQGFVDSTYAIVKQKVV